MKTRRLTTAVGILSSFTIYLSSQSLEGKLAKDYFDSYQRPQGVIYPKSNQFSEARAELGKMLFFDPRLSGSDWISCATCHNPGLSWGDGLAKGIGHEMKQLGRRTPTILNLAWGELMFWDGRSETLEDQALGPIEAAGEMNLSHPEMLKKLNAIEAYLPFFEKAYPKEGITTKTVAKALATYERGVVSGTAPFDDWIKGKKDAISSAAQRGFLLFNEKAKCAECHSGWRFTDDSFHDIGVKTDDKGRGAILDEKSLYFTFKTPTLRSVNRRSPFMHNGSEANLRDVIELYNLGGRVQRETLSDNIVKLGLSKEEVDDLLAFLDTLTSKDADVVLPVLPR